jgi:hypothetical protein
MKSVGAQPELTSPVVTSLVRYVQIRQLFDETDFWNPGLAAAKDFLEVA